MLEQGRVIDETQRLNKFYISHKQPQNIKDIQHENSKLINNTLPPIQPHSYIPSPTPQPQQVIASPPPDYKIATSMEQYVKWAQDETTIAQKENREPDLSHIKQPDYKIPITKTPVIDIHRYINNPNYNPIYKGKLLNNTDYNTKMNNSKQKIYSNYNVYKQNWTARHNFLAPNPQYRQVEYLLEKKQQQQENTSTIRNSDAYKRGLIDLQQSKKEFGSFTRPMIKLGYNSKNESGRYFG